MAAHQPYFVCPRRVYGWVEQKNVSQLIYCCFEGRSAGTDWATHAFPASPQNCSWMYTSTLERRHTAAVQAAAENICRGQTPTCRRPSVFAFLWRNCICGKTSNIHSPGFQMCYTQKKSRAAVWPWLSVLCQLLRWCRSLLFTAGRSSCPGSTPGENTGSPHWTYSVNQLWSQWPTNLFTPHDFPVTLSVWPLLEHSGRCGETTHICKYLFSPFIQQFLNSKYGFKWKPLMHQPSAKWPPMICHEPIGV